MKNILIVIFLFFPFVVHAIDIIEFNITNGINASVIGKEHNNNVNVNESSADNKIIYDYKNKNWKSIPDKNYKKSTSIT